MTDLRKAAEMALEELENVWNNGLEELTTASIEALRQALAQPEQEPISRCKLCGGALPVTHALVRTGECDCLAQTDQ